MRIWVSIGAFSGFISVALGAFAAHALTSRISERSLEIFRTGVQYQFYHALALILFGLWLGKNSGSLSAFSGWAFVIGTLLFSGSLYLLATTGIRALGAITPFGGLAFLAGWIVFAYSAWKA